MFDPAVVQPVVDVLPARGDGGALEFAIGTGRIALPLAERGVRVAGIDSSDAMLRGSARSPAPSGSRPSLGDMTTTRVDGEFSLVYLVFNTIGNLDHAGRRRPRASRTPPRTCAPAAAS